MSSESWFWNDKFWNIKEDDELKNNQNKTYIDVSTNMFYKEISPPLTRNVFASWSLGLERLSRLG